MKLNIFDLNLKLLPFSSIFYFVVLCAMKDDSEKVPSLLTDYILKGEFYKWLMCNGWEVLVRSISASSC